MNMNENSYIFNEYRNSIVKKYDELVKLYGFLSENSKYLADIPTRTQFFDIKEKIDRYFELIDNNISYNNINFEIMSKINDELIRYNAKVYTSQRQYVINDFYKSNYSNPKYDTLKIRDMIMNTTDVSELLNYKRNFEESLSKLGFEERCKMTATLDLIIERIALLTTKENEPINPSSPDPKENSAAVGNNHDDVVDLINNNQYFEVLHGIPTKLKLKYEKFINDGFNHFVNNWKQRLTDANEDELVELYSEMQETIDNFGSYIDDNRKSIIDGIINSIEPQVSEIMQRRHKEYLERIQRNNSGKKNEGSGQNVQHMSFH